MKNQETHLIEQRTHGLLCLKCSLRGHFPWTTAFRLTFVLYLLQIHRSYSVFSNFQDMKVYSFISLLEFLLIVKLCSTYYSWSLLSFQPWHPEKWKLIFYVYQKLFIYLFIFSFDNFFIFFEGNGVSYNAFEICPAEYLKYSLHSVNIEYKSVCIY